VSRVLVVDDSAVDRELIGGLIEQDEDLVVSYAVDGAVALASVVRDAPDVIVTDLIMPKMDGLELVASLQESHPFVPVILVTSKGNEEKAVQALQEGAASYVPKHALAAELLETIETALSAADHRRSRSELMKAMQSSQMVFEIVNQRQLFAPLIDYLQESIADLGMLDGGARTRVGVALEEALVNAAEHGNLDLDSSMRQDDRQGYLDLLESRLLKSPYADRRIHVEAHLSADEATFVLRDEGQGFDWRTLPDPTDPANLLKVSGRGVMLMRTFMDEVVFNEVGNQVTLVKRCDGS